jgi:hypothetical protein
MGGWAQAHHAPSTRVAAAGGLKRGLSVQADIMCIIG